MASPWGGKGAVASGCGPGAPDHRRTKERQPRCRRYIGCCAAKASFTRRICLWPLGGLAYPGAAELIAHEAPSGDQAPPSRWPRVRIPYPGPEHGNRIGRRKFRNRNEHRPHAVHGYRLPTAQVSRAAAYKQERAAPPGGPSGGRPH